MLNIEKRKKTRQGKDFSLVDTLLHRYESLVSTANIETEHAISEAEGGGCVTKEEDDHLTINAENITKMANSAQRLVLMLSKSGYSGHKLAEAKACLNRLKLQQYKALAADERLNENEAEVKKPKVKEEDKSITIEKEGKEYIKLDLNIYEKRKLFDGLDFEFDKTMRQKKKNLDQQKLKMAEFLKQRNVVREQ